MNVNYAIRSRLPALTLETSYCIRSVRKQPFRLSAQTNSARVYSHHAPHHFKNHRTWISLASRGTIALGLAAGSLQLLSNNSPDDETNTETKNNVKNAAGATRSFRLAEVRQHDASSPNPWIIRGTSVYDITDWVSAHPGGAVILTAAGGSVEPYWDIFSIHKRSDVYEILEQFKIGEIDNTDLVDGHVPQDSISDPFQNDPERDRRLITLTPRPRNAETPTSGLDQFITPNELFYVRNHFWVPAADGEKHEIVIELPDGSEKTYTVKDLKERFQRHKITTTLQCSGNRRKAMTDGAQPTQGLQWTMGAISTAEWEGVKLLDVLADAGLDIKNPPADAQHIQFSALEAYGASIPIRKAIDPWGDVLLAFAMNGVELPRDHGHPVRVVVPGTVAARSVKWLSHITVSPEESPAQWQQRDYKSFCPSDTKNPDWSKARAIQEMPVTSATTHVELRAESLYAEGYAYSGGGREIIRVDVSVDGGKTWQEAELVDDDTKMSGSRAWCWKRWKYKGQLLPRGSGEQFLVVKATDDAYNTQPETFTSIYNARGNLATAWHRTKIK